MKHLHIGVLIQMNNQWKCKTFDSFSQWFSDVNFMSC